MGIRKGQFLFNRERARILNVLANYINNSYNSMDNNLLSMLGDSTDYEQVDRTISWLKEVAESKANLLR